MPKFECWDEDVDVGLAGDVIEAASSRQAAEEFVRQGEYYPSEGYEGVLVADEEGNVVRFQFDVRVAVVLVLEESEVMGTKASLVGRGRKWM